MKLVITAITVLLAAGCGENKVLTTDYPWPATGIPAADSAMTALLSTYSHPVSVSRLDALTENFAAVADRYPSNAALRARVSYWRARNLFKHGSWRAARDTILSAMVALDSASYSYDYFKLRSELERTAADPADRFKMAQENVNFFSAAGDSISVAHSLLSLGFMYLSCSDSLSARNAFERAGAIWRNHHMEGHYIKCMINVALASNGEESLLLWKRLEKEPLIRADTMAYETVMRNLVQLDGSQYAPAMSRRAMSLIGDNPRCRHLAAFHRAVICLNDPQIPFDSLIGALLSAHAYWRDEPEGAEQEYINTALVAAWETAGRPDSALAYSRRLTADIDHANSRALAISVEAGRHALAEANLKSALSEQGQQRTFLLVVMVIVIIASFALFVLYRRRAETELREKVAQTRLQESQSRLARETLLFEEKERMIDDLRRQIEDSASEGHISPVEAGKLLNRLKIHATGREERQAFLDIYDNLHPDFTHRLKEDYPALTEGQLKLAAYIGSGMSNNSIARLLNITLPSVRTNRYRLRSRFGLGQDVSLEDFLRRYIAALHAN